MSAPRVRAGAGAVLVGLLAAVLTAGPVGAAAGTPRAVLDAAPPADGPVTVSGSGPFADLKVTVSQTTRLIDQVVEVSWSGGTPTVPDTGAFAQNYLQIMQCWGDDPAGPDREQCQYGATAASGDTRGGAHVTSRQVNNGPNLVDPAETLQQPPGSNLPVYVPFRSVTGTTDPGSPINQFFDASSTNEIAFGRTRADGTGQEFMELQTGREAPGLGCGEPLTQGGTTVGRSCWLVVVPRGATEVDGSVRSGTGVGGPLDSSPLSASNWAHRIAIPLTFQPMGTTCAIGAKERPVVGQESVAEAITRWQPSLCASTGATYGYSQVSDTIARRQLTTLPAAGLAFVSRPLAADQVPAAGPPVYAPVAVSGLTIAFDIESQSSTAAPADVRARDGIRLTDLKLTPRLVAKLLTQSYRGALNNSAAYLATNPQDMTRDEDFLRLNPAFRGLLFGGIFDALTPIGPADAYSQLWRWVNGDPDARAFLNGRADPWGMVVNKNYTDLPLPRDDLPKSDLSCVDVVPGAPPLCMLDAHSYAADMHDAARSASRGDTQSHAFWDALAIPPSWKKGPLQLSGKRDLLAITDTATAARFDLPTAQLCAGDGTGCVAPTRASLDAALATAQPAGAAGVVSPDPAAARGTAYPLTTITYAAAIPAALDPAARHDYAALLRYAAGPGQTLGLEPGQLPVGYAPLTQALRTRTLAAANAIEHPPAGHPTGNPGSGGSSNGSGGSGGSGGGSGGEGGGGGGGGGGSPTPAPATSTPAPVVGRPSPATVTPAAKATPTPGDPTGPVRYALVIALLAGALAAGSGPVMRGLAGRRGPQPPASTGGES